MTRISIYDQSIDVFVVSSAGLGIYWYFTFLQYLFIVNIVLILVALINFIPHMAKGGYNAGFPQMFYLSSYDKYADISIFSPSVHLFRVCADDGVI
jgi:hypothetical protein